MNSLCAIFQWVLRASWQAAVLAVLVLIAQFIFRKKLSALVVARLVLPDTPQSDVSIFNVSMLTPPDAVFASTPPSYASPAAVSPQNSLASEPQPQSAPTPQATPPQLIPPAPALAAPAASSTPSINWLAIASLIWLSVACLLALRLIRSSLRFNSRLARHVPVRDAAVLATLEDCKRLLRVRQNVSLIETDEVSSPAICGLWKKRLLLPDGSFERFSPEQLRHVFLHELAHVKRRDLVLNWLTAWLEILHWFNPVLWFAFARMRADREMAADALVLKRVGAAQNIPYGETILKALENLVPATSRPGLVGIAESKARLTERLAAIARWGTRKSWRWLAGITLAVIAALGFTSARVDPEGMFQSNYVRLYRWVDGAYNQPHFLDPQTRRIVPISLEGRVVYPGGKPVPTIILLETAERRSNVTYSASTRYPRLPKSVYADASGNFKFEGLDPAWTYFIRPIAVGCEKTNYFDVDPLSGSVTVNLEPQKSSNQTNTVLRGMVLDTNGAPVPGALIQVSGATQGDRIQNGFSELDSFSISDTNGDFALQGNLPFSDVYGSVEAPGFAVADFQNWNPDDPQDRHEIRLTEGASLQGRLVAAGKPVPNAEIHFAKDQRDRIAVTDGQGRFSFAHLPSADNCSVFATMESLAGRGALQPTPVHTLAAGSNNDLGDINLQPAFTVAGKIRLRGGRPLPANSQVILEHQLLSPDAHQYPLGLDAIPLTLGPDGAFRFSGVPADNVWIHLWVPGYVACWHDMHMKRGQAVDLTVKTNIPDLNISMRPATKTDIVATGLWYYLQLWRL